jgi:hypothetical protein
MDKNEIGSKLSRCNSAFLKFVTFVQNFVHVVNCAFFASETTPRYNTEIWVIIMKKMMRKIPPVFRLKDFRSSQTRTPSQI